MSESNAATTLFDPELPGRPPRYRGQWWIYGVLLGLFVANALYAARANSGVCDELGAHIPAGYLYWSSGRFSGGLSNFPLGQLLIAGPVHLLGYSYELYTEQHLLLFRLPVIALGALLGILVARMATQMDGERAGVAALCLYALSPNILAHSSLATLDLPATFFVFLTVFCLYRLTQRPTASRVLTLALVLGLALVSKLQTVALLALVPAIVALFWRRIASGKSARLWISFALAPIVIVGIINLTYLHWPFDPPANGPGGSWAWSWLPPQFLSALEKKWLHGGTGHFSYLWGEYSQTGWWYYFPVAILLKTPIPTLVLAAIGLCRRPSLPTAAFVLAPIVLFLALGIGSRVDIGLRHVLIVYPFFFLLGGRGVAALWQRSWGRAALGVLGAAYFAQAIFITPHQLSYFNALVGGPSKGHHYLIDSNYDWGQNDHFLRRYLANRDGPYQINPNPFAPTTGHILVNANALYGVLNGGASAYRWLDDFEPVRQIAYTWFEFAVPDESFAVNGVVAGESGTRQALLDHTFALQERFRNVNSLDYRLFLAKTFSFLGAHDVALAGIRAVLAEHPSSQRALATGGELIVRYKLGVLAFRKDEYLTGVRTARPPHPQLLTAPTLVGHTRELSAAEGFARLYTLLARALIRDSQLERAREMLQLALALDPRDTVARKMLNRLE